MAGILPDDYWRLTPTETAWLLRGHKARDAQLSLLVAVVANVFRGSKSTPVRMADVSVFAPVEGESAEPQTAEHHRALLEAVTVMLGGEVRAGD